MTIADLTGKTQPQKGKGAEWKQKANNARVRRVAERKEAAVSCAGYVTQAKEQTLQGPPFERRARVAKARSACAADVAAIEERAATALRSVESEREQARARARSSQASGVKKPKRGKRTQSTAANQESKAREEAAVLVTLEPELHPFYHSIKNLPMFKDFVRHHGGPLIEAIKELVLQNPGAAIAAFEKVLMAKATGNERDRGGAGQTYASGATQGTQRRTQVKPPMVEVEDSAEKRRAPQSAQVQKVATESASVPTPAPTPTSTVTRSEFGDAVLTATATTLEFQFPEMPHREVLDALRGAGFRWDGATRKWLAQRSNWREKRAPKILALYSQKAAEAAEYKKGRSKKAPVEPSAVKPPQALPTTTTSAVTSQALTADLLKAVEPSTQVIEKAAPPPVDPRLAEPTQNEVGQEQAVRVQKLRDFANHLEERALFARDLAKTQKPRWLSELWPKPAHTDKERLLREAPGGAELAIAEALEEASDLRHWADVIESNRAIDPNDSNEVAELIANVPRAVEHVAALRKKDVWSPAQKAQLVLDAERNLTWHQDRLDELTERDPTRDRKSRTFADAQMFDDAQLNVIEIRFKKDPPERTERRLVYNRFRPNLFGSAWSSPRDNRAWWAGLRVLKDYQSRLVHASQGVDSGESTTQAAPESALPSQPPEPLPIAPPHAHAKSETSAAQSNAVDAVESEETERSDTPETSESPKPLNRYEEKKAARIQRLQERAGKYHTQSESVTAEARKRADAIPFGQPILVGHHSEHRDRRYRERIRGLYDKGFELQKKAQHYSERAQAAEKNRAISSDDPDAISKIEEKIAAAETQVDHWKKINKVVHSARRRHKEGWEPVAISGLKEIGISPSLAEKLVQKDFAGRYGIPDYEFTNTGAEIRRLKKRIAELQARDGQAYQPPDRIGGAEVSEDREENRVRIVFDEKPGQEVRKKLKQHGFRWAPSENAWQRAYSSWQRKEAERLVGEIFQSERGPADGAEPEESSIS